MKKNRENPKKNSPNFHGVEFGKLNVIVVMAHDPDVKTILLDAYNLDIV